MLCLVEIFLWKKARLCQIDSWDKLTISNKTTIIRNIKLKFSLKQGGKIYRKLSNWRTLWIYLIWIRSFSWNVFSGTFDPGHGCPTISFLQDRRLCIVPKLQAFVHFDQFDHWAHSEDFRQHIAFKVCFIY